MYIRFPLSLRQVEDLLHERGIDICYERVRVCWNRFRPMFAAEIRKKRSASMRAHIQWRWHLDEVFVRINGATYYLWRAVDHESEVLEAFVTKQRDRKAALGFLRRAMKRYGRPEAIVTDHLRSYRAAMREIGNEARQETGRWLNNWAENSHQPFRRRERAMAKFRSPATLQKFAAVHASVLNHFNQERPSTAAGISSSIAPLPLPSGANFLRPEVSRMAGFRRPVRFSLTPPIRELARK